MANNLEIIQGSDYTRTFTVVDSLNVPINITGFVFKSHIRRNHTTIEYMEFTPSIINATLGKVSITLEHAITSTLEGKYVYDIFLTDQALNRYRISDGIITIIPNITKY